MPRFLIADARVVLKDYVVTRLDDLYAPTPTSMTVRCLLFYATWLGLEVSTSDVRVAFMHAVTSEPKFAKPPVEQRAAGWLWLIKKAMNGMRTASKDFGALVADVMVEIQFERGKADPQIYKDTKSQAAIVFHVDDPILASSHQQTAPVWRRIREHMLLNAHEVMTPDRPIKYLSTQYVQVHAHGRRGFKVRCLQNTSTVSQQQWKWSVAGHELSQGGTKLDHRGSSWPRAENPGSERPLAVQSWSWKTAVHDQRSA